MNKKIIDKLLDIPVEAVLDIKDILDKKITSYDDSLNINEKFFDFLKNSIDNTDVEENVEELKNVVNIIHMGHVTYNKLKITEITDTLFNVEGPKDILEDDMIMNIYLQTSGYPSYTFKGVHNKGDNVVNTYDKEC